MADSVVLYGFGDVDRSGKVRWTAAELGLELQERPVGFGEHRAPPYIGLNPLGQVPTAEFRGQVLVESTAICHTLAEAVDYPKLWVGRGEPARSDYLYWLAAFAETCEARLVDCAVSRAGILGPEVFEVHAAAMGRKVGVLAGQLPTEGWLCGAQFTLADIVAGYNLRLAVQTGLVQREATEPYLSKLVARPAATASRVFASL